MLGKDKSLIIEWKTKKDTFYYWMREWGEWGWPGGGPGRGSQGAEVRDVSVKRGRSWIEPPPPAGGSWVRPSAGLKRGNWALTKYRGMWAIRPVDQHCRERGKQSLTSLNPKKAIQQSHTAAAALSSSAHSCNRSRWPTHHTEQSSFVEGRMESDELGLGSWLPLDSATRGRRKGEQAAGGRRQV